MATALNKRQIETLWIEVGGSAASAQTAAAIALAESGGSVNATNHNTNGSVDRGLFQINSVHGKLSTYNLEANIRSAIEISRNGSDWAPWATFKSGAYKEFLGASGVSGGVAAGGRAPGGGGDTLFHELFGFELIPGETKAKVLGIGPENPIKAAEDAVKPITSIPEWISKGGPLRLIVDALLVLAGLVLLVYGVMVAVRPRERALSIPRPPLVVPV